VLKIDNKVGAQGTYSTLQKITSANEKQPCNKQHHHRKSMEQRVPQGSCVGPGMWNIFHNSLLNLTFMSGTKIIAFADDLLLLIRGKSVSEVENIANIEIKKAQGGQKKTRSVTTTKSQK
jgi:hypothetical protein